jgi:hypothetical protein
MIYMHGFPRHKIQNGFSHKISEENFLIKNVATSPPGSKWHVKMTFKSVKPTRKETLSYRKLICQQSMRDFHERSCICVKKCRSPTHKRALSSGLCSSKTLNLHSADTFFFKSLLYYRLYCLKNFMLPSFLSLQANLPWEWITTVSWKILTTQNLWYSSSIVRRCMIYLCRWKRVITWTKCRESFITF